MILKIGDCELALRLAGFRFRCGTWSEYMAGLLVLDLSTFDGVAQLRLLGNSVELIPLGF